MKIKRHYLSVVAIMKDEGKNLQEWLQFHRGVGVEHFYLYDNGSTDDTKKLCEGQKDISYFYTDMDMCQMACYYNALTAFRDQSRWMAFIDLDEFLFAPGGDLKDRLKDFEQYPGVAVNEVFYGSNGFQKRPAGGVLRNYVRRGERPDAHIKSIVQPMATLCPAGNPHSFVYTQGVPVNEQKVPCPGPFNESRTVDLFRINHYWVKSKEEYEKKITRGRADVPSRDPMFRYSTGIGRKVDEVIQKDNEVYDTAIWEFLERDHG